MSSGKAGSTLEWSFGLRNCANKYLTAETFGNKIVCAASIMKKKQIFFLESADAGADQKLVDAGAVFIKSHLGNYLTVDGDGKFTCDSKDKGDEQGVIIKPQPDGKWALQSYKYGWYMGGTGENLTAFTKEISDDRLWTVHLAMHPQVNLFNVQRKAYVHLTNNSFSTDEIVPWGMDATVTVHFFDEDGTYGIISCNGDYLTNSGALTSDANESCHFILEFQGGMVSFKSKVSGKYVTALGAPGTLKANKASITKDEQFLMEDSYPQISLKGFNGKYISTKQGVELAATATAVTDKEIFQIEPLGNDDFDGKAGTWALKSCVPKYWSLDGISVQAKDENSSSDQAHFTIEWNGPSIRLKAQNGKYVEQMNNTYLHAKAAAPTDKCMFTYEIVNRQQLVLRGEYGFVGTLPSGLLECNKSTPTVHSTKIEDGKISILTGGKHWKVHENGVSANGDAAEHYHIEIYDNSKLALWKPVQDDPEKRVYFQSHQNGAFTLTGTSINKYTLFEY